MQGRNVGAGSGFGPGAAAHGRPEAAGPPPVGGGCGYTQ